MQTAVILNSPRVESLLLCVGQKNATAAESTAALVAECRLPGRELEADGLVH